MSGDVLFLIGAALFLLISVVGFFWALIDAIANQEGAKMKLLWVLVILFAPFGWVLYYFIA